LNNENTISLFKDIEFGNINKPKLLLHVCCAPCSCGVLPQLDKYFDITALFYNPNIYPKEEHDLRLKMLYELKNHMKFDIVEVPYDESIYLDRIKGLENEPEGGKRCIECFKLRMEESVKYASLNGFSYFTTTLSVSPHKDAQILNNIGESLELKYGVKYLYSDFKKKDGFKNSVKISKELNLYRQEYCGCRFSLNKK